jgi:hypothetical protein
MALYAKMRQTEPEWMPTAVSTGPFSSAHPKLQPLQKYLPPQPQRQIRNIHSPSQLFYSFYKL